MDIVLTNIYASPEKMSVRDRLFQVGLMALEKDGWTVSRVTGGKKGSGKGSVRQITKGGETKLVSIRTTQDRHIAFPRNPEDSGWSTLEDVDYVCAVSVDSHERPMEAWAHLIDQKEMLKRFNRAYRARLKAGRVIQNGRGMWLSLYREETTEPVDNVGAGVGRPENYPTILKLPLWNKDEAPQIVDPDTPDDLPIPAVLDSVDEAPLTIPEAKRRLAVALGVDPSCIKISVEA